MRVSINLIHNKFEDRVTYSVEVHLRCSPEPGAHNDLVTEVQGKENRNIYILGEKSR